MKTGRRSAEKVSENYNMKHGCLEPEKQGNGSAYSNYHEKKTGKDSDMKNKLSLACLICAGALTFGGSAFAGFRFAYFWRAELEAGYLGYFEDADHMAEYNLQIPYAMANLYYDFTNGLYLGVGAGVAMPIETIDMLGYADGSDRTRYGFAPMIGVMLGYSYELDYNLVLDVRYRLSGLTGWHHRIDGLIDMDDNRFWFENEVNFVLDNSISIGLRYEF